MLSKSSWHPATKGFSHDAKSEGWLIDVVGRWAVEDRPPSLLAPGPALRLHLCRALASVRGENIVVKRRLHMQHAVATKRAGFPSTTIEHRRHASENLAVWGVKRLSKWAAHVNPHVAKNGWLQDKEYDWITEQAEFASDVIFKDQASLKDLTESKIHQGRGYAGFNPARSSDVKLFQANRVSRLLKRLHVRGLLAKIPRTRRWRVTSRGRSLLGAILQLHYHGLPLAIWNHARTVRA